MTPRKSTPSGITRTGKGLFRIRVTARDPVTGKDKEKQRTLENATMADAVRAREELRGLLQDEIERSPIVRPSMPTTTFPTVGDFAGRWLVHVEKTGRARKYVAEARIGVLERFILPFLGHLRLDEIRAPQLSAWMEKLSDVRRDDGGLYAEETLRSPWRLLRTMLRDAQALTGLDYDPTAGVRFRVKGAPSKEKDALTREELARLLDAAKHEAPDIRVMITLGFVTGARFSELSALLWSDVNFEAGTVHIGKSQVGGAVHATKTAASVRELPLPPPVVEMLRGHQKWQDEQKVRGLEKGLLFPSKNGTHRYSSILTAPLLRCCERAGISKHITSHALRRTLNNLVRQTAGEVAARAMTGHVTQGMTLRYSVVDITEKRAAQSAALDVFSITTSASNETTR